MAHNFASAPWSDSKEFKVQALLEYVARSEAELKAADLAPTRDARIAHLEQAYRYARLAVEERAKQPSIFQWPARRWSSQ
jgi:hypothetical protein